jgi:hypothetical protein
MELIELPVELLSRVCRFTGRQPNALKNGKYSYENKDFISLRSTCKEIYARTNFDASVRYGVHELMLELSPSSLAFLLHLSKIPAFRNRMTRIHLFRVTKPQSVDEYEWFVSQEDEYSFVRSGEAAYMLAQCFRHLHDADSFIELILPYGRFIIDEQTTVLRALQLSEFPWKVAFVYLWVENSQKPEWGRWAECLSEFRPYIEKAIFLTPQSRRKDVTENREVGAHIQNMHLNHPNLLQAVAVTTDVERLELQGCRGVPELRICHGCEDLFSRHIMTRSYEDLLSLQLSDLYISGSRLRGFLKQARILFWFEAYDTTLTNGSWKSIYQGLRKLPDLLNLQIRHNYQKHGPLTPVIVPDACRNGHPKDMSGHHVEHDHVKLVLDAMVTHFHVRPKRRKQKYRGPRYYEVCLFEVPRMVTASRKNSLQRYAGELEGK